LLSYENQTSLYSILSLKDNNFVLLAASHLLNWLILFMMGFVLCILGRFMVISIIGFTKELLSCTNATNVPTNTDPAITLYAPITTTKNIVNNPNMSEVDWLMDIPISRWNFIRFSFKLELL